MHIFWALAYFHTRGSPRPTSNESEEATCCFGRIGSGLWLFSERSEISGRGVRSESMELSELLRSVSSLDMSSSLSSMAEGILDDEG